MIIDLDEVTNIYCGDLNKDFCFYFKNGKEVWVKTSSDEQYWGWITYFQNLVN
jgi:small nuclear ribonucleoprotein (snRNP)-like protein